jgi:hypothetical protein
LIGAVVAPAEVVPAAETANVAQHCRDRRQHP